MTKPRGTVVVKEEKTVPFSTIDSIRTAGNKKRKAAIIRINLIKM